MEIIETNLSGPRFELALERFRGGEPLTIGDITLDLASDGHLDIYVQSGWLPENVTEQTAREDLQAAENYLDKLISQSDRLATAIGTGPRRLILVDGTKISYKELGYYVNGQFSWAEDR